MRATGVLPTGTVSFLFTDIEGSTELLLSVGDQAYKGILEEHHRLMRAAFEPVGGYEVDTQGMGDVRRLLADSRLVTLTGPGGSGKTRLALQVAADVLERFPKGVWLVELAPLTDPGLVPQAVASVLGVRESPGRLLVDLLVDYLRTRELLLVLDNCEHVVESAARLAGALLRGCGALRLLATSREPLAVAGEVSYRVPPLSYPDLRAALSMETLMRSDAAKLFLERAALSNPRFVLSEANAPAVAQVIQRLDGIPLAIELAAARVRVLPVEQIAKRLDDRFRLLTGGSRAGLPHHQTLQATVAWSYDLLSTVDGHQEAPETGPGAGM
jgi:non-specific serine/threonine protein kinase